MLTLVRGPQAFRLALAPMTNDFVALLKDSSLVSVLTVLELTKQTQIFATNLGSWVIPGTLCAALYLAMSLPLARAGAAARAALEERRRHERPVASSSRDAAPAARRRATILRGVDLRRARAASCVALMGPSGSGKTTILRAVAGLERFQAGAIDGRRRDARRRRGDPRRRTLRALRRKVGMVFQFHCLFEHLSAIDNVCLAPVHAHGVAAGRRERAGAALLRALGVEHRADALPRELSGGEAQRVAIARALAVDPPLLLMDEPTASLDPARRDELGELLQALRRQGRTLVIATHDEDFARDFATRVIVLSQGCVVESGLPREVLSNPQHAATRELLQVGRTRVARGRERARTPPAFGSGGSCVSRALLVGVADPGDELVEIVLHALDHAVPVHGRRPAGQAALVKQLHLDQHRLALYESVAVVCE